MEVEREEWCSEVGGGEEGKGDVWGVEGKKEKSM